MWIGPDRPGLGRPLPVTEVAKRADAAGPRLALASALAAQEWTGCLREGPAGPARRPLGRATVHRVLTLTCAEPPSQATHWTGRAMAKTAGLLAIGAADLGRASPPAASPAHLQALQRPAFADKLEDIVGLYMTPRHALALSLDEKTQIQALDRTQPGLPLKPGVASTMTHDTSATARPPCSPRSTC